MRIPYEELPSDENKVDAVLNTATKHFEEQKSPFALLVRKGIFSKYTLQTKDNNTKGSLCREDAMRMVTAAALPQTRFIAGTGFPGRELFEIRPQSLDFYCVG